MKHFPNKADSQGSLARVWECYKRLRLEAWGVRKEGKAQSKVDALSVMCTNESNSSLLAKIVLRGEIFTNNKIKAIYELLSREADKLRDSYFFLRGEQSFA